MICLTQDCGLPATQRGLCHACRAVAGKMVKDKQTSWPQLEALGLAAPGKRERPSNGNTKFHTAYRAALAKAVSAEPPEPDVKTYLLAACKMVVAQHAQIGADEPWYKAGIDYCRAAIAKAEIEARKETP